MLLAGGTSILDVLRYLEARDVGIFLFILWGIGTSVWIYFEARKHIKRGG